MVLDAAAYADKDALRPTSLENRQQVGIQMLAAVALSCCVGLAIAFLPLLVRWVASQVPGEFARA